MKSAMIILIIHITILLGIAQSSKKDIMEEYDQYQDCLERYEKELGAENKIKVIHAIRGADVILPCFTCVSPDDGKEIESTYKPSSGVVGRSFNTIVDFFKDKFMKSTRSMPDRDRWKFDWEFAKLGRGYIPLSSMHFSISDAISDRIRRFMSKDDAQFKLGDRYELVLKNVDVNSTGYYRCLNRNHRNIISNIYFLEVSNSKQIEEIKGELGNDHLPKNIDLSSGNLAKSKLRYTVKASSWSRCSYCSSDHGEQFRTIKCYVESASSYDSTPTSFKYLYLFDKIPCSSTLLPTKLRKKLREMNNHKTYIEFRSCFEECTNAEFIKGIVSSQKQLSEVRTLDVIPGGELIFGDVLPRLLPPVVRRVQLVVENDPLVLSCQKTIDLNSGVHWFSLSRGQLTLNNTRTLFAGRAYFDEESNLVFERFSIADDDEYFCYSSNNILLATFHIRVVESDRNEQVIDVIRIFVKFCAFVLIFSLIANQLFQ